LANLSKLMMNGETGVMQPMQFSRKQSYFVNFQPVPDARFSLGMILNEKMLFHQIYSTNRNVLLLLIFEIILLLFVVYRLIIKRMRFLKELSNTIDYMGKGVFGTMLPEITTQDEFLQLSDDFHQMQERISNHFSNCLSTTRAEEQEACKKEQKQCFQNLFLPTDYRKFAFSPLGSCTLKINYFPAKTFGGDFYDYFFFNEHQFCLLMGNVGGTSASKSLQIAFIMSLIREQLHEKISLARFTEQLNNRIQSINEDQRHIKLLLTVIDSKTQTMNFVNIGYDLLYLIREQVIINIESIHGKALGMVADAKFSSSTLGLHKGDMLFFFDSAAANFLNKSGVNYSKERVEQLLTTNRKESPVNLLNYISEDIDLYLKGIERPNDYTMMALKFFEDDHHDEK
ncbi:MAG: SpoIIE family protein phosphatase, partial [Bacteroidales bacterium]|nr:SpoIIE family protein phosphatase [Bacteroidales bacterium]